jgi:UDP-GlcNAc:undecaprenyl-phosphate GlcNAc-1-phosphate transferase
MNLVMIGLISVGMLLGWTGTRAMLYLAPRIGFVDKPGGRKIHAQPKSLGGGVGITAGLLVPLGVGLALIWSVPELIVQTLAIDPALLAGVRDNTPLALTFMACVLVLHFMGLLDDARAMGPYTKLFMQFLVACLMVMPFPEVRIFTALDSVVGGPWLAIFLSILWIVAITNAMNFLDNMDGLSAGVAVICATALLVASLQIREQWFVAAVLACLIGSTLGFLRYNFPPARIFMGDAGSLVLGFVLGVMSIRITFLPADAELHLHWFALFAPIIALALPLYDLIVVSVIRIANGKSPFHGDKNHFSHRLVDRGMSRRTAVLCLYLVTAATSIAAVVLPGVRSPLSAALIVAQTVLVLGVVMLLEQHPIKSSSEGSADSRIHRP